MKIKGIEKFIEKNSDKIMFFSFFVYIIVILFMFFPIIGGKIDVDCVAKPLVHDDYAFHYIDSLEGAHFFKEDMKLWAYSPFHYAGFPTGIFMATDAHYPILFQIINNDMFDSALVFNLSVLSVFLALPLIFFFGLKNFGLKAKDRLLAILGMMSFLLASRYMAGMLKGGLFAFVFCSFLSFLSISYLYRYLFYSKLKDKKILLFLFLSALLAIFVHPLSIIILIIFSIPLLFNFFKDQEDMKGHKMKKIFILIFISIVIFILNLFWILPLIRYSYLSSSNPIHFQTSLQFSLKMILRFDFIILFSLFLYFRFFTRGSKKEEDKNLSLFFDSSILIFVVLSFFGSQLFLEFIQPARFIIVLEILMLVYISYNSPKRFYKTLLLFTVIFFFVSLFIIQPHRCGYETKTAYDMIDYVKELPKGGRILVQDSHQEVYFESHFISYLQHHTKKETLSGPFNYPFTRFKFLQTRDNIFFGKDITKIDDKLFKNYFDLYNVRYILTFSKTVQAIFEGKGYMKKIKKFEDPQLKNYDDGSDSYVIYEYIKEEYSYCMSCNATINSGYDHIEVSNAQSDNMILKYHYIEGMKTQPESVKIRPVDVMDDPVPFIYVENEDVKNFTIYI